MSGHLDSIVAEVASRIASGAVATTQGNAVMAGGLSVHCRDHDDAQALLDEATARAATAEYDPIRAKVAADAARVAATNKASLLHERNRWLTETDPYVLPVPSLPSDMPGDVLNVLAAQGTPSVQDQLKAWRQDLREYPATVTDWTAPPPLPAPPNITLPSGRPLVIVT